MINSFCTHVYDFVKIEIAGMHFAVTLDVEVHKVNYFYYINQHNITF